MVVTIAETALASSCVAAAAVASTIWSGLRTGRAAREDRLWQRRAEVYVDLLAWAIRQRELAKIDPSQWVVTRARAHLPDPEELIVLEARVSAFASSKVDRKVNEITRPWNLLRVAWGDLELLSESGTDVPTMRQMFDQTVGQPEGRVTELAFEVEKWVGQLISLVRAELAATDKRRSS